MLLVEDPRFAYRYIRVSSERRQRSGSKSLASILGPSEREVIFFAEIVVCLAQIRVIECGRANIRDEVVRHACALCISRRPELQQRFRNRIRDCRALRIGRHSRRAYGWSHLAEPLPVTEEKRLVLDD